MTFFTVWKIQLETSIYLLGQDYTIICDYEERIEIMSKIMAIKHRRYGINCWGVLAAEALKELECNGSLNRRRTRQS